MRRVKKHDCAKTIERLHLDNGWLDSCMVCCRQIAWNNHDTGEIQCIWKRKAYKPIKEITYELKYGRREEKQLEMNYEPIGRA